VAGSNFIAFRVDDDMAEAINQAVSASGMSKTEWLTEAIMIRLGTDSPEARLAAIVEQLESVANRIASTEAQMKAPEPRRDDLNQKAANHPGKPAKRRMSRSGELTEAQRIIIDMQKELEESGADRIDYRIAEALNDRQIPTASGEGEWTNRIVMNTKVRLKRRGQL